MAIVKVIFSRGEVQNTDGDANPIGYLNMVLPKRSALETLVTRAVETSAFPGAKQLEFFCAKVEHFAKQLETLSEKKPDAHDVFHSVVEALNLKEEQLINYQLSLSKLGHRTGRENEVIEIDELSALFGALVKLDNGLKHYIEEIDLATAQTGIKHFRTVVTSLVQNRLDLWQQRVN